MAFKYTTTTLKKIEEIFKQSAYVIRYERGSFNSGYCILEDKQVIVINKFYDTESRINCLIEILSQVKIEEDALDDKMRAFHQAIRQQQLDL